MVFHEDETYSLLLTYMLIINNHYFYELSANISNKKQKKTKQKTLQINT